MSKNMLSGRDRELHELAKMYESAKADNKSIYLDADDLVDLTDWYMAQNNIESATEVLDYGLKLHPDHTQLLIEKTYLLLNNRDREEAKKVFEQIKDDYSPEVTILKANFLVGEGKMEEAEQLLDTLEDKDDLDNIFDVAYMYIDTGFPQKAQVWIDRGKDKYEDSEAYLAITADCLHMQGLMEQAEVYYNKLIDRNPYSANYWFGLAQCYYDRNEFDKAIEACDFALIANEEFGEAYLTKAQSFYNLGNGEKALENYALAEKYKVLSPEFLHMVWGINKLSADSWAEALSHLEQAIECQGPNSTVTSSLYAHAAFCLYKLGDKRKAGRYFNKAHKINPEDIDAYLIEGRLYLEEGEYKKAMKKWGTALDCAPTANTWSEIGMYSMDIGELEFAKKAFEHVKEMEPDFEGVNEKLASIYLLLKDKENFTKYNQLCKRPVQLDELEELEKILQEEDQTEMAQLMKNILDALH